MKSNFELYDLLVSFQNGNEHAFKILYEDVKNPIFYNILAIVKDHLVAEDLLQDTFVRFLSNSHKIKPKESILGYLMVISKNIALDYLKKVKERFIEEDETHHLKSEDNVVSDVNQENILNKLKVILNDKEFQIFILHIINGMTFEEISKFLKIPLGTATYTYNNSIKKIKTIIKEEDIC